MKVKLLSAIATIAFIIEQKNQLTQSSALRYNQCTVAIRRASGER